MLKIKLPGKKSMESNDVTKQSTSREEIQTMKKKSSAANVRNTGRISSIRVLYEYKPEPEDTERKKSTEEIILYDRNSRSEDDVDTNTQGDTKQGNEGYNVLPRKSLSKTVSNAKSQGDAKLETIVATPSSSDATPSTSDAIPSTSDATLSSSDATNKIKSNEVHLKIKDIAKAKKLIKAAKNNKISHTTMMTRGRLKKILETEYGVSAFDYISVKSPEKPFVIHDLRKPAQKKRPGSPIKRQVKKTKK